MKNSKSSTSKTAKIAIHKIAKILCERYYLNERDALDAARSAYRISQK